MSRGAEIDFDDIAYVKLDIIELQKIFKILTETNMGLSSKIWAMWFLFAPVP